MKEFRGIIEKDEHISIFYHDALGCLIGLIITEGKFMNIEEKIINHVHELPETKKAEVLEFVNYLMTKSDYKDWSGFSLSSAMRGMEDEEPPYSLDDIKE